jgi:hypothetical protein
MADVNPPDTQQPLNANGDASIVNDPLDIQDYLDASSDASKRTRSIIIIMVAASVLVLAGLLNSVENDWMLLRLRNPAYPETKIPSPDRKNFNTDDDYNRAVKDIESRREQLITAIAKSYVDNSLVIHVPFFGFSLDVNDLGLIGGISFLVILGCFRFFLSRELDNLHISFKEAKRLGKLAEFYTLLAMRQVFTVPDTEQIRRSKFLLYTPKIICWFPLVVHIAVTLNDIKTGNIGNLLSEPRYGFLLVSEILITIGLVMLSVMVTKRLRRIDTAWKDNKPAPETT